MPVYLKWKSIIFDLWALRTVSIWLKKGFTEIGSQWGDHWFVTESIQLSFQQLNFFVHKVFWRNHNGHHGKIQWIWIVLQHCRSNVMEIIAKEAKKAKKAHLRLNVLTVNCPICISMNERRKKNNYQQKYKLRRRKKTVITRNCDRRIQWLIT